MQIHQEALGWTRTKKQPLERLQTISNHVFTHFHGGFNWQVIECSDEDSPSCLGTLQQD